MRASQYPSKPCWVCPDPSPAPSARMWRGCCWCLISPKCDLVAERAVSAEEGGHLTATLGMAFVETSAHSNLNVELVFQTLAGGIQQALGQVVLAPYQGCDGIRLIPSQSHRQAPAWREPRQRCQC
uniref:small monomeric GTPase n=1 Tax=Malurus cyaneus samueli TaxID=2593467 RepID=A0A8C5ULY3_9PASS